MISTTQPCRICDIFNLLFVVVVILSIISSSVDAYNNPCPTNFQHQRTVTDRNRRRSSTGRLLEYGWVNPSLISTYRKSVNGKGWRNRRIFTAFMTDNDNDFNTNDTDNEDEEETILRINLSILDSNSSESTMEKIVKYIQSFPFSAVLPVQPLTYVPSEDNRGVKVTFLRKKTKEKGSVDGGIHISATLRDDNKDKKIEIEAKRNSEGQTVSKVFSEMLIVKAFIKGLSGEDTERTNTELEELVSIDSVFHKWM